MNILFVCKWNRFRSKAAEAIFKKLDKKHKVRSGGLFPGVPISQDVKQAGKNIGIKITNKQRALTHKLLMWSDYIIIVADDVPKEIFKEVIKNDKKKVIQWKFKDVLGTNVKKREILMLEIKNKIEKFLKEINQF